MDLKNFVIYSDMDGTLLTDWDRGPCVPKRNLQGIRKLMQKGGAFSIATGRQYKDTMAFFPDILFNAPTVQGNGAVIYDCSADKVLKATPVLPSCKKELVEYTRRFPNLWLAPADVDRIYEISFNDARDGSLHDVIKPRSKISIEEFYSRDFIKVCFILGDPAFMPQLEKDYANMKCSENLNHACSSPIYFECYDRTVDKGKGVLEARKYAGLEDKKLVCIGDYFNDRSMLLAADIAACPENAPQEIKDICSIVTCNNNEGAIGDLIDRLEEMQEIN